MSSKNNSQWSLLNKSDSGRCWSGYEPTPGKKPYEKGSCRPVSKTEDKKKKKTVNVGGGDTVNRRTYLEAFGKSDGEHFVDVYFFDDGSFDVVPQTEMPQDKFDFLCDHVLSESYQEISKSKDWAPKAKHKSDKGGLTEEGRKSYNKATGGNLKAPQPQGGPRKRSFCARNRGQIKMHNIDCSKTPDKRACKARRRWKC